MDVAGPSPRIGAETGAPDALRSPASGASPPRPRLYQPLPGVPKAPPRLSFRDSDPSSGQTPPAPAPAKPSAAPLPGQAPDLRFLLSRWYHDIALFAWECFGLRLWSKQRLICRLVAKTATGPVRIAVASGHKTGKALALDTPIPTPTGWTTMGELKVGDEVLDEHGAPTTVVGATPVMYNRRCYDVRFSDGTVITADAEHLWTTESPNGIRTSTTVDILDDLERGYWHEVRNPTPVRCPETGRIFEGRRQIVGITPRASVPVRCIRVDSASRLYLASRAFIPTHNSKMLAVIAIWFAITRPAGRVIITAPTARQIRDTLWREVTALYKVAMAKGGLLDRTGIGGLGGKLNQLPDRGLRFPDGSEVVGFSTNSPERMAGTSGEHLLYLIDEASGVEQAIFDAIEGNRAGDASVVMFSNPTRTSGYFFEAFNGQAKLNWHRVVISSEETPNAVSGKKQIPGLATRPWVLEKRTEWGPDWENDPRYQVRVLGRFPRFASNQIVPLHLIEKGRGVWYAFAAKILGREDLAYEPDRWKDIIKSAPELARVTEEWVRTSDGPLSLGVDPAWQGDDMTVVYARRGARVFRPTVLKFTEGKDVRDAVMTLVRKYRRGADERPRVRVDAIGVGAAAVEYLRGEGEIALVEVNSSQASTNPDEYRNLRTESLFAATRFLQNGGGFEPDAELERDLGATTYIINAGGQLEAEPKKVVKKRLGRSPDRGDAFSLCVLDSLIQRQRVLPVTQLISGSSPGSLRNFGERKRGF